MPTPFKHLLAATLPAFSFTGMPAAAEDTLPSQPIPAHAPKPATPITPSPTDWGWSGQVVQTVEAPIILPPPVPPEPITIDGVRL